VGSAPATGAKPAGRFTATLSGRALNWRLVIRGASDEATSAARIQLSLPGTSLKPIALTCERCNEPGLGFIILTTAQATALRTGGARLSVRAPSLPDGALAGRIVQTS
jgi:hypothetical protein